MTRNTRVISFSLFVFLTESSPAVKSSPKKRQQQSNEFPDISIPYDKTDEYIPYVDDDIDDDDGIVLVSGVDASATPSSFSDVFASASTSSSCGAATSSVPNTQPSQPPIVEENIDKPPPNLSSKSDNKRKNYPGSTRFQALAAFGQRHPRVKKNSTRVASFLLFLLLGYFLTIITAVIVYRASGESLFLF